MFGDVAPRASTTASSRDSLPVDDSDSEMDDEADDKQENLQAGDSDGDKDEIKSEPDVSKSRRRGSLDNSYLRVNGLLPGTVPDVLKCLNAIEQSMIAKVNTVTKVRLVGSSHYVATTPTLYNLQHHQQCSRNI
jgi:hypothetical protein